MYTEQDEGQFKANVLGKKKWKNQDIALSGFPEDPYQGEIYSVMYNASELEAEGIIPNASEKVMAD